jgi:hypothetical protein
LNCKVTVFNENVIIKKEMIKTGCTENVIVATVLKISVKA